MRKVCIFILLLFNVVCFAKDYMFKHIEAKDGLSSNQINNIFKDKAGYMWFSTASGLDRFDGRSVKVFRSSNMDMGPLADNFVEKVQEDIQGNLWIQTLKGYSIYNPTNESFNRNIKEWMSTNGINGVPQLIYIARNKDLWSYVPNTGIFLLKPETKLVYVMSTNDENLPKGEVRDIAENENEILLVYGDGTLVALNKSNASFRWRVNKIANITRKGEDQKFTLFVDTDGDVWIYGALGLWVYNPEKKSWNDKIRRLAIGNNVNNLIRTISQDNNENIWIGNDQGGITVINKKNSEVNHLVNVPNDERSIQNNNITSFYNDNKGTMWVGTYKKGVSFYNESAYKFGVNHIGDINCFEEDKDGSIWLGTNDTGLINWHRKDGSFVTYTNDSGNSISSNTVVCLMRDHKGSLWIGTFWGGLNHLQNGHFTVYKNNSNNENSLSNNNVWALCEDEQGKIWIGTLGGGLQSFNPEKNEFKTYNVKSGNLLSDYVSSLYVSGKELVVGTSRGIALVNTEDGSIINLMGSKSGKMEFSNLDVNQVYKDTRGLIWIATREGLNVYNPKADVVNVLSTNNGLSSNIISGIAEDYQNSIWVTTSRGLTNISLQLDKKSGQYSFMCVGYDVNDGLQNCEFNQRSIKRLDNGDILMGGLYGVNYFNPQSIKYNKLSPNVIFSGLSLFNQEVNIGDKYNNRVVLSKSLNSMRSITLDYKQNVITINVASDDYVAPEKIKYMYKLEGFNDEWLVSNSGKISFTNLSAGKYMLKVKAVNNDGYTGPEAQLEIIVLPPYWLSIWAFIFYGLLVIGLFMVIRHLVMRSAKNKLKMHKMQTEAEKAKELNDLKTKFFINISHELRTPLTMVISPLEALIKEHVNNKDLDSKLKIVHSNAVKLLDQVNQLLDFRKSEANSHQLSLKDGDIISFIRGITEKFRNMAEAKGIRISFFSNVTSLNISFDSDKMEKVVNNLLSNAIKFTQEGGIVDVNVGVDYNDAFVETLEIKVTDNGIGIKDEDKEKVFERFYQVENSSIVTTGSGVGLSIVKDFVELFKGTIKVYDNVPKGSIFLLEMPVKRSKLTVNQSQVETGDGEIRAICDPREDSTPYIHTIQEIRAPLALGKSLSESDQSEVDEEANMKELGIDTVSTIRQQKATVIQITEEGDNKYRKHVISSEDIPEYDPTKKKIKDDDKIFSEMTRDMMLDKDGKPKVKIEEKQKVLVVDDDIDFLQFMKETLSIEYDVQLANNGTKAWDIIKETLPDIIISDLKMPQMDGKKLCSLVKNNRLTAQIPFILLTSADSQDYEAEGLHEGADEFISKPFNIEILMLRMKKLLELKYNKFHSYIDPSPSNITITSLDEKLIDKAIKYIEENISRSDFSVEELSKELGMSRVHLYKKLLGITGKTPIEFIRVIRLKRAAQFLRESQQNVSEIAFQVGFNNPKYFTKYFKEEFGVLPSVYQENRGK